MSFTINYATLSWIDLSGLTPQNSRPPLPTFEPLSKKTLNLLTSLAQASLDTSKEDCDLSVVKESLAERIQNIITALTKRAQTKSHWSRPKAKKEAQQIVNQLKPFNECKHELFEQLKASLTRDITALDTLKNKCKLMIFNMEDLCTALKIYYKWDKEDLASRDENDKFNERLSRVLRDTIGIKAILLQHSRFMITKHAFKEVISTLGGFMDNLLMQHIQPVAKRQAISDEEQAMSDEELEKYSLVTYSGQVEPHSLPGQIASSSSLPGLPSTVEPSLVSSLHQSAAASCSAGASPASSSSHKFDAATGSQKFKPVPVPIDLEPVVESTITPVGLGQHA